MDKIRVLRVLEYVYDDLESYLDDSKNWSIQSKSGWHRNKMQMSSTVVSIMIIDDLGNWASYKPQ